MLPIALLLAVPLASAGVAFELELDDAPGDVLTMDRRPVDYASGDILAIRSTVVNGTLVMQEVEMRARPVAPDDSILLRSWFRDSENGTFYVIDMEVRGDAPDPAERFLPVMRRGDFHNATHVEGARYGLRDATWLFEFPAAIVEDATCFDPGAFAEHSPPQRTRLPQGFDSAYLADERRCVTALEPAQPIPPAPIIGVPPPPPEPSPPGSVTPTPIGAWVVLAGILVALVLRRR